MRQIDVSVDVFARIWALREEGESSEDDILRRVLREKPPGRAMRLVASRPLTGQPCDVVGVRDNRFGVEFAEGFTIERTYLGRRFRAVVEGGSWHLIGVGSGFTRLNELSRAIGTKTENAWVNWYYFDEEGRRHPVADLRDPQTVSQKTTFSSRHDVSEDKMLGKVRWCDDVRDALKSLGGEASLDRIYKRTAEIRRTAGRSVPGSLEATIRRTLEDFSSDSDNYRGEDWFEMAEGKGRGVWRLRGTRN